LSTSRAESLALRRGSPLSPRFAMILAHRVYDRPLPQGRAFLVDRLWPRGVRKDELPGVTWLKDVAPSDALRHWFGHDPARWDGFRERFAAELDAHRDAWTPLSQAAHEGDVVLLYGARDTEHNNAVALREYLARHAARPRHKPASAAHPHRP
jgi:uncharacterized protein YeaO (DUF488 family)